jgi:hypothetical protein
MDDSPSPYAPPKANIQVAPVDGGNRKRVFSAWQAGIGTFVGGPLAGVYFLRTNLAAKGEPAQATAATVVGLLASLALMLGLPLVPDKVPSAAIPVIYASVVWELTGRMKLTRAQIAASEDLACHSGWRVAAVAVVALVLFLLLFVGAVMVFPHHFFRHQIV